MSHRQKKHTVWGMVALGTFALAWLFACGKKGSEVSLTSCSGVAVAGFVAEGTVTAYALNADGTRGDALGTTTTGADGSYSLDISASGPIEIAVTGGTYIEEATGEAVSLTQEMRVRVASLTSGAILAITPLTEIAVVRSVALLEEGTTLADAITGANTEVAETSGLTDITEIPADASQSNTNSTAAKYALVLAGISQFAVTHGLRDSLQVAQAFAADFRDGSFNGSDGGTAITFSGTSTTLSSTAWTTGVATAMSDFKASEHGSGFTDVEAPTPVAQPSTVTPTCSDVVKNADETDVDCGGGTCSTCGTSKICSANSDCTSAVCTSGVCVASSCSDSVKNGAETDVDCGGGTCSDCGVSGACLVAGDCTSGVCTTGHCVAGSCADSVKNNAETDVDCGGGTCGDCDTSGHCLTAGDCLSGVCSSNSCQAATCEDTVTNGAETDVDCGGGTCSDCGTSGHCLSATDCLSGVCASNSCQAATCADTVTNGAETDTDCGGGTCTDCGTSKHCLTAGDCLSGVCSSNTCQAASCVDAVKNGNETDVDCGGSCGTCGTGALCSIDGDCTSSFCTSGTCHAKLSQGQSSSSASHCSTGQLADGVCCNTACTGTCKQCNLSGQLGTCVNSTFGTDPDNACGGKMCSGTGACNECSSASDCPAGSNECQTRACTSGSCGFTNVANGTPIASQTSNDCKTVVCNGSGSTTNSNNDSDLPTANNLLSSECAAPACNSGTPDTDLEDVGTACSTDGGVTCDGSGHCTGGSSTATGHTCASDVACDSGFCTDGFCCNTRCNGQCSVCSRSLGAGQNGQCSAAPSGQAPAGSRPSCGAGLSCNGSDFNSCH